MQSGAEQREAMGATCCVAICANACRSASCERRRRGGRRIGGLAGRRVGGSAHLYLRLGVVGLRIRGAP
jgi:hypothetical protein